jgi:SAM-dependent methyltransferase
MSPEYQNNLSVISPILLNGEYKRAKVEKMLAILGDAGILDRVSRHLAVDVGCSRGFFCEALAPYFKRVVGVDIDAHALNVARGSTQGHHPSYILGDSLKLPFRDRSVDLVICNHVYEHVPNADSLFKEISRILSKDGICYLGAASRLTFIEPHYHLPFLSWLPKGMAHRYMRLFGKGEYYYENLRTYWGIQALLYQFDVADYTLKVVSDPDRFKARDLIPKGGWLDALPLWLWRLAYPLLPSFIFLMTRRQP